MSEIKEKAFSSKAVAFYFFIAALVGLLFFATYNGIKAASDTNKMKKEVVASHIKTVILVDRNCNDCHLGASFVNLFSHDAVKNNDNVVIFIMNKVNIKRW